MKIIANLFLLAVAATWSSSVLAADPMLASDELSFKWQRVVSDEPEDTLVAMKMDICALDENAAPENNMKCSLLKKMNSVKVPAGPDKLVSVNASSEGFSGAKINETYNKLSQGMGSPTPRIAITFVLLKDEKNYVKNSKIRYKFPPLDLKPTNADGIIFERNDLFLDNAKLDARVVIQYKRAR